jgi:hypothetical protein
VRTIIRTLCKNLTKLLFIALCIEPLSIVSLQIHELNHNVKQKIMSVENLNILLNLDQVLGIISQLPVGDKIKISQYLDVETSEEKGIYLSSKHNELLQNLSFHESTLEHESDFYSLFGSWQSEKTGDEINHDIYSSRNDNARIITL